MKITICSSMYFAKKILEAQKALNELGHECLMPHTTKQCLINPNLNMDFEFCVENNCMMDHYGKINESDAVLVLNYPKNDINGYIGGAVLMEMAIAKFLGKKIFLLHDLPDEEIVRYAFEIKLTKPIILNGDLTKIK